MGFVSKTLFNGAVLVSNTARIQAKPQRRRNEKYKQINWTTVRSSRSTLTKRKVTIWWFLHIFSFSFIAECTTTCQKPTAHIRNPFALNVAPSDNTCLVWFAASWLGTDSIDSCLRMKKVERRFGRYIFFFSARVIFDVCSKSVSSNCKTPTIFTHR